MKVLELSPDVTNSLEDLSQILAATFKLIPCFKSFKNYLMMEAQPEEHFTQNEIDITIKTLMNFHSFNTKCMLNLACHIEKLAREAQGKKSH